MLRGLWYTHPKEVLGETWLKQTDLVFFHTEILLAGILDHWV